MTGTRERKRKELARSAQKLKPYSCFIHAPSAAEPLTFSNFDRPNSVLETKTIQPKLTNQQSEHGRTSRSQSQTIQSHQEQQQSNQENPNFNKTPIKYELGTSEVTERTLIMTPIIRYSLPISDGFQNIKTIQTKTRKPQFAAAKSESKINLKIYKWMIQALTWSRHQRIYQKNQSSSSSSRLPFFLHRRIRGSLSENITENCQH
uniref:Uncharacterized protein n=1 Tax=Cucumis melo TaxID=3656 RepID=A0A9I9E8Q2_CUCME